MEKQIIEQLFEEIRNIRWRIMKLAHDNCTRIKGEKGCIAKYKAWQDFEWDFKLIKAGINSLNKKLHHEIKVAKSIVMHIAEMKRSYKLTKGKIIAIPNTKLQNETRNFFNSDQESFKIPLKMASVTTEVILGVAWCCALSARQENNKSNRNEKLIRYYLAEANRSYGIAQSRFNRFPLETKNKAREKNKENEERRIRIYIEYAKKIQHKNLTPNAVANKIIEQWSELTKDNLVVAELFKKKPSATNLAKILRAHENSWRP